MALLIRMVWLQLFLAILTLTASAASSRQTTGALARAVDQLCTDSGLRRSGQIKLLNRTKYPDLRYRVEVPIIVDGSKHVYTVQLNNNFKIVEFQPEGWPFVRSGLIEYPPGYDTYKDPNGRDMAISAVRRFNDLRDYHPPGLPAIQKVGQYVLVTYQWTSRRHQHDGVLYRYAVLSFIVTRRGTICGELWGTWPTNGKWPLLPLPRQKDPAG